MMNEKTKGATINGYHTYRDFGLIMTSCSIEAPTPITKYYEVPGRKTPIDATESLSGGVTYKNRKIVLGYTGTNETVTRWIDQYSQVLNTIHGQLVKVTLDTDPNAYWMGRAAVKAEKKKMNVDSLTITITAEPYKYWVEEPSSDWLWDPFNFKTGVIQNLRNQSISGTTTVKVTASSRPLMPTVTPSANMSLRIPAKGDQPETVWTLKKDTPTRLEGVLLFENTYDFIFTGTGTATISFRGESL